MTALALSRRCLWLLALAAALLISGPARADLLADIQAKKLFTVGTEGRFPPFEFVQDGKIVGYSQDIMDLVMQDPAMAGVKLERLDLPWQGILPGLAAERFDYVVTSVTATPERFAAYHLSAPVADATVSLLKRAGDDTITRPEDLAGKTIGSQTGSAQLAEAQKLADRLAAAGTPVAGMRDYVDFDEAFADLAARRVDAVANSLPNVLEAARQRPQVFAAVDATFGPRKYFAWAGRKAEESASLNAFMDRKLAELNADGTLAKLQEKWFGRTMELPVALPEPKE